MANWILGLTGGIGSGKSAVSAMFEKLGITVVDADIVAREVVEPGSVGLKKIVEHFGKTILTSEGVLDRAKLRGIIFDNETEKAWLNALLHPLIRESMLKQLQQATNDQRFLRRYAPDRIRSRRIKRQSTCQWLLNEEGMLKHPRLLLIETLYE